jgi:hypothetical protein
MNKRKSKSSLVPKQRDISADPHSSIPPSFILSDHGTSPFFSIFDKTQSPSEAGLSCDETTAKAAGNLVVLELAEKGLSRRKLNRTMMHQQTGIAPVSLPQSRQSEDSIN